MKTSLILLDQPSIIKSYKQFIYELKNIQKNYDKKIISKNRVESQIPSEILQKKIKKLQIKTTHEQEIDLDSIFDGYIEQKLFEKSEKWEYEIMNNFLKDFDILIKKLRKNKNVESNTVNKIKMMDLNYLEENFEMDYYCFSNEYLACGFEFLVCKENRECKSALDFLEIRYQKFIMNFLKEFSKNSYDEIEEGIEEYVKLRYNPVDYQIEMYDDRYLYAEIYTLIRCGLIESAQKLILKYKKFLQQNDPIFYKNILKHLKNKNFIQKTQKNENIDKFKGFLCRLISNHDKKKSDWIFTSIEDYLWFQFYQTNEYYTTEDIIKNFLSFSDSIQFLVSILCQNFKSATDILLKGDFSICEIFFLLKKIIKVYFCPDLLIQIIFIIASNFSNTENKYKIIQILKPILKNEYENIVSKKIIEYKLYDILGINTKIPICEQSIIQKVGEILKQTDNKKIILKMYYLFDDTKFIINVLNKYIINQIINDQQVEFNELINEYKSYDKLLRVLDELNRFRIKKDFNSLRKTVFLNKEEYYLLKEIPMVVEKMIDLVCDVVKNSKDGVVAREMFNLCVMLELSDDVCRKVCDDVGMLF